MHLLCMLLSGIRTNWVRMVTMAGNRPPAARVHALTTALAEALATPSALTPRRSLLQILY